MLPVEGKIDPFLFSTFVDNVPILLSDENVAVPLVVLPESEIKVGLSDSVSCSAVIENSISAIELYPEGVTVSESL
ncbi:hypothetical protein [Pseudolactococcus paracarnosus]|uniref:Uncharacterized protein n=1 Tax=Pseudolactococcus paracarnosus TaxID=2749962 RepID=A0A7L4WEH5_9LACT|nr:hypothetical protein [Lactococcus paracarnosus]QDJ27893.1 hypothetical protein BHS01_04835 [Lactococcus paracarnosus]